MDTNPGGKVRHRTRPRSLTRLRIYSGVTAMDRPDLFRVGPGRVACITSRGPGDHEANEDALALIPIDHRRAALLVADGMGGESHGQVASRFLAALVGAYAEARVAMGADVEEGLLRALEATNREILKGGVAGGTTAAIALVQGGRLSTFHVGDSRVFVVGRRGRIRYQTEDHTFTQDAVNAGTVSPGEALRHADRHLLTNVVGDEEMRVETWEGLPLLPTDTMVLATDGLVDNLNEERIVRLCRTRSLAETAVRLHGEAVAHMQSEDTGEGLEPKPDNISVVVYRPSRRG
jgi:serine/threonine protein phosphatase PrpC